MSILGIYHIAGLGTSPGAVTAPLNYHFERFKRHTLQQSDPFFHHSGSYTNPLESGNLEGLIIFTTPDIFNSNLEEHQAKYYFTNENESWTDKIIHKHYANNKGSFELVKSECQRIKSELTHLTGKESNFSLYVAFFDFDEDLLSINTKSLKVFSTLSNPGKLGKETWINLVGGQNKVQLSFYFSAMLIKNYSRAFYYQCPRNQTRFLRPIAKFEPNRISDPEPNYWIDLPIFPSKLSKEEDEILRLFASLGKNTFELSEIKQNFTENQSKLEKTLQILKNQRYIKFHDNLYEITTYGLELSKFLYKIKQDGSIHLGIKDLLYERDFNNDPWFIKVEI